MIRLINWKKTQIVQTIKSPITSTVGNTFKDISGNCWKYNGSFPPSYTVPLTFISLTYTGNYFSGSPSTTTTYSNCASCAGLLPVTVDIDAAAAFCNGGGSIGTIDDTLGVQVNVLPIGSVYYPLSMDTTFTIDVYYVPWGSVCIGSDVKDGTPTPPTFQTFTVVVPSGAVIGQIDPCGSNAVFISGRHVICGACITSVSGNTVDTITIINPLGC